MCVRVGILVPVFIATFELHEIKPVLRAGMQAFSLCNLESLSGGVVVDLPAFNYGNVRLCRKSIECY